MKKHTRVYMKALDYVEDDFIPSEISGKRAVDVHHIDNRGAGGSLDKDYIENLMALTREEHVKYGDKVKYYDFLKRVHRDFLIKNGVRFNEELL